MFGVALADGFEGEEKRALGENLVYRASELGYADARAFMGDCFLHGSKLFEVDFAEARVQLELAATEDHPRALANLGAMYEQGKGGPINHEAAFECTRRAAEAGYPQGQYNLFVLYLNGHGVLQDESRALYWLTTAAEQQYPRALLELARFTLGGRVEGKSHADAEKLLQRCTSQEVANLACYELAKLYCGYTPSYDRLLQAAHLLQECYEREGGEGDLAQKCWDLSPTVVHELNAGLAAHIAQAGNEAAVLLLRYFDANGHPVKSRADQNRAMYLDLDRMAKARTLPLEDQVALAGSLFVPHLAQKVRPRPVARVDVPREKTGRNSPCTCGSGKKFKVCCGRG